MPLRAAGVLVGPWFRESRLAYPELGPLPECVDELLACGLAEVAGSLSLEELAGLFTRAELATVAGPLLDTPLPRNKPGLLAAIAELALEDEEYLQLAATVDDGRIIAVTGVRRYSCCSCCSLATAARA